MRGNLAISIVCAALAGCGSQTDTQLAAVKSARSVLAEWAWVEQQAGKAPVVYTQQMRQMARDELQADRPDLPPAAAAQIDALLAGHPGIPALQRVNRALEPYEKQLESA